MERVDRIEQLKPYSWFALKQETDSVTVYICLGELAKRDEKVVAYGVTKKTKRTVKKLEYFSSIAIVL